MDADWSRAISCDTWLVESDVKWQLIGLEWCHADVDWRVISCGI